MKILKRFNNYFYNLSTFRFILIMTCLIYFISITMSFIYTEFWGVNNIGTRPTYSNLLDALFWAGILAPLFETLLFQCFPINILKFFTKNNYIIVIFSSLCFGLLHLQYSLFYLVSSFFTGIVLAYSYLLYDIKNKNPFWVVGLVHALNNIITVLLMYCLWIISI